MSGRRAGESPPEDKTMKKSWLIRKDEEAVSPVIATILMVAITVVLAAVLYVMVSGLIGGGVTDRPVVTMASAENVGAGSWKVQIADASLTQSLGSYKVVLQADNVNVGSAVTLTAGALISSGGVWLNYTDLTVDGNLNGGDFFILEGAASGTTYSIILIWSADGSQITSRDISA
jgi:flagellin-like protein